MTDHPRPWHIIDREAESERGRRYTLSWVVDADGHTVHSMLYATTPEARSALAAAVEVANRDAELDRIAAYNEHARTCVLYTTRPYADRPQHLDRRLFLVRVVEPTRLLGYFADDDQHDVAISVEPGDFEGFDQELAAYAALRAECDARPAVSPLRGRQ